MISVTDQSKRASTPRRVRLAVEDAARLLAVPAPKLRRMAAFGEVETEPDPESGALRVVVDIEHVEIPAPAAARLVGVAPVTMRSWIAANRVRARHEAGSRSWLVRVEDLLGDARFPSELRAKVLGFEQAERRRRSRPARELPPSTRQVLVRLGEEEYHALVDLRPRYGTIRETVATALLVLAADDPRQDELARVRSKFVDTRGQLEAAREEVKAAKEEAARQPRAGWCSGCNELVPWSELEPDDEHGVGRVLVHRHTGVKAFTQGARTIVAKV
jgi:hypothetical protein